jgi:hypothetical protein
MSAYHPKAAVIPVGPLLAEAVEKLWAGSSARNNGIGMVRRVNLYCRSSRLDESLLR